MLRPRIRRFLRARQVAHATTCESCERSPNFQDGVIVERGMRPKCGGVAAPAALGYSPGLVIPLICFSRLSRLQSPGVWLGGYSFMVSRNLLAIDWSGTRTKARSIIQSW